MAWFSSLEEPLVLGQRIHVSSASLWLAMLSVFAGMTALGLAAFLSVDVCDYARNVDIISHLCVVSVVCLCLQLLTVVS